MKKIKTRKDLKEYYFDKDLVDTYIEDRFKDPLGKILHETQVNVVNKAIKEHHVQELLEFAPGPGRISLEINGFQKGVMVDSSENMLNLAEKRIRNTENYDKWSFEQSDVFDYTTDQVFELVFTFRFIRHLDDEKRMKIYAKIRELLKDKGLLIFDAVNYHVSYPLRQKNPESFPVYDKLYTREELIQELHDNGFHVIKLHSVQCHLDLQDFLNKFIKFKIDPIVYFLIKLLENPNSKNPLEWIVLCQKR
ncbi:MAG: methyltransferase domain-containing protein [Deltaproteobacteria bacterium]|nr:methyltransferase domain-containing protein [Deltaproteobacteria bacterium]